MEKHDIKKYAEIGVWRARGIRAILKNYHKLDEYWAIDNWAYIQDGHKHMDRRKEDDSSYWDGLYFYACQLMRWFPNLHVVRLSSVEAARLFPPEYFDMVFIDADHWYYNVVADIKAWEPLVKKNGVFCGHDYISSRHYEVKKAVHDTIGEENIEVLDGSIWLRK